MKVVHIVPSSVSGSPLRIVNALNKYTDWDAVLVTKSEQIDKNRCFPSGLDWRYDKDKALREIESADILHAHEVPYSDFNEIKAVLPRKTPIIYHHHTSKKRKTDIGLPLYEVSIPQHAERYSHSTRLLPNIIGSEKKVKLEHLSNGGTTVFFAPTLHYSAWHVPQNLKRWMTKGATEVSALIKAIREQHLLPASSSIVNVDIVERMPFEDCLRRKRRSDIVIDDVVTGSYHLVGLESLAMGIPTLGYIDRRIEWLLKDFTGASSIPWVNVRLEELGPVIETLVQDDSLRVALGDASYSWMQQYYREDILIQHFAKAYYELLEDPSAFNKSRFNDSEKSTCWFVRDAYEAHYESRKRKQQRGAERLGAAIYMDYPDSYFQVTSLKAAAWISNSECRFGSWLYKNRHRSIDAQSDLFYRGRREGLLEKYRLAASHAQGKDVVDLGSGTGYGAALLKEEGGAAFVVGVELDMLAAAYAQEVYAGEGITYLEGDAIKAGLSANSFGLVAAIDLLEWVDCDGALLDECVRLLAPGGTCVISAGDFWSKESEAFYQRRYSPKSFRALLQAFFGSVTLYRQCYKRKMERFALIPDSGFNVLAEGESLIAVCKV